MCVCLSVCRDVTVTFEPNDIFGCMMVILILARSNLYVKAMVQNSRSHDENISFSAMDARYKVTCTF